MLLHAVPLLPCPLFLGFAFLWSASSWKTSLVVRTGCDLLELISRCVLFLALLLLRSLLGLLRRAFLALMVLLLGGWRFALAKGLLLLCLIAHVFVVVQREIPL